MRDDRGFAVLRAGLLVALASASLACAGASPIPRDARRVVVSLRRIDCAECGEQIVADLRARPGVYGAAFDKRKAELSVVASSSFDVLTAVKQLAAAQGFEAILGEGRGAYFEAVFPSGSDARVVSRDGADVPDLAGVLVPGKVTVVDFYAPWCRPCGAIDDHMLGVLQRRGDVAYRKLDMGDWDSPLSRHYLKEVPALPYVIVYDAGGARVKAIGGADFPALDAAIGPGAAPEAGAPAPAGERPAPAPR